MQDSLMAQIKERAYIEAESAYRTGIMPMGEVKTLKDLIKMHEVMGFTEEEAMNLSLADSMECSTRFITMYKLKLLELTYANIAKDSGLNWGLFNDRQ